MPDSKGNGRRENAGGKGHCAANGDKAPVRAPADVARLMAKVRSPQVMNLPHHGQMDYSDEK